MQDKKDKTKSIPPQELACAIHAMSWLDLTDMEPHIVTFHLKPGQYLSNKQCQKCNTMIATMPSRNRHISHCMDDFRAFTLENENGTSVAQQCHCILCSQCHQTMLDNSRGDYNKRPCWAIVQP